MTEEETLALIRVRGSRMIQDLTEAMVLLDQLPGDRAESALNDLCRQLAVCRAMTCSWANDHGEP